MPYADKGARYASILADFPACVVHSVFTSCCPEAVKVEVLQNRLDHPWSLAFLPDNKGLLVTLKGGQLKRWQAGKGLSDPIVGVPKVWANGQGGLLDVVLAPDFEIAPRLAELRRGRA
jgi:glucose/arabinose dehydrogenase